MDLFAHWLDKCLFLQHIHIEKVAEMVNKAFERTSCNRLVNWVDIHKDIFQYRSQNRNFGSTESIPTSIYSIYLAKK